MSTIASRFPKQYQSLLDEEMWSFIEQTLVAMPPELASEPVEIQRLAYDKLNRHFNTESPDHVRTTDILASTNSEVVQCRLYQYTESEADASTEAVIVYFHGGGFVFGNLDSHDGICAEICERTQLRVVSAEYRLSPEHAHPAAFTDAVTTYQWARQQFDCPIILCGDSAGANLAAAVSHHVRDEGAIANALLGQVLIYPALGGDMSRGSYQEHRDAPMLTLDEVHYFIGARFGEVPTAPDSTAAPLQDQNFSGLPPTITFSAECDPLRDDGADYCHAIRHTGGVAQDVMETGLVHGYLRARHTVERARISFTRICEALSAIASSRWPDSDNHLNITNVKTERDRDNVF